MANDPTDDGRKEGYTDREHVGESAYDVGEEVEKTESRGGDGFPDVGVVAALVVVGLALIVFPEPATSIAGILFVAVGVGLAVLDAVA